MKKHLVFMHQNYPAQFGPVTRFLLKEHDVRITFISEYASRQVTPGINHIYYKPTTTGHEENPYFFSRFFERECASMHGIFHALHEGKVTAPDAFIGHAAFGTLGLLHVEYANVPRIGFFELFYDPTGRQSDNRPEYPSPKPNRLRIPLRNATQLVELEYCTRGYSPTPFQRSTYPEAYRQKLSVLFDGIDTRLYRPGEVGNQSKLQRTWPTDAKIVTYVSRGLEAMRGFDIFMEMAHKISQKRSDVHFVIAGNPKTHYGSEMLTIKEPTFKEYVLKKHPYDLNRFHFVNWLPESALVDLLRLSDCHFYWTTPFTLSWSLFQAMSTGALVLGSNTLPVRDLIRPGLNGLLVEPYDVDSMVETVLETLDNPQKFQPLREFAREHVVENYGFSTCLPKLADFYLKPDTEPTLNPPTTPRSAISALERMAALSTSGAG